MSAGVVLTPRSTEDAQSALRPAVVPPLPPEAVAGSCGRAPGKWANAVRDRAAGTSERAWNDELRSRQAKQPYVRLVLWYPVSRKWVRLAEVEQHRCGAAVSPTP